MRFLFASLLSLSFPLEIGLSQAPCGFVRLEPEPNTAAAHFGSRVVLSRSFLAVGRFGAPQASVVLFDRWSNTPLRRFTGVGVSAFDGFPAGLALDDTELVAGGGLQSVVYVFDAATGRERTQLAPESPISFASFGRSIAMNESLIAVGAPGPIHMASGVDGTIHLFDRMSGVELSVLQPQEFVGAWFEEKGFGTSVALGNGIVVGGAPTDDYRGSVHAFDIATRVRLYRLDPGPGARHFGASLSIGGGRLAVGDNGANSYAGRVSVYELVTGQHLYDLEAPGASNSEGFGLSLAMDEQFLVVGAPTREVGTGRGVAFVFDPATGALLHELTGDPIEQTNRFGGSVAVDGGVVAVGDVEQTGSFTYSGAAYQIALPTALGRRVCFPAVPNSTGASGVISAAGCAAIEYELTLLASQLPADQLGMFVAGMSLSIRPGFGAGSGTLCIGMPLSLWRAEAGSTGAQGVLELEVDTSAIPGAPSYAIAPGETWWFQCWHRDTTGGSNLTDVRGITFQ